MDRHLIDVLFTEGVIDSNTHLKVTERAAGANMSVDVAIGQAVVDGDDQTDQGSYFVHVTAVENVVIGAPPGSNSRIDLVVLRIQDPNAGGPAGDNAIIDVIQGIAGASPSVPATPASCLPLAQVLVTNGDTSVVDAAITDLRVQSQAQQIKIGTQLESMTAAARATLAGADLYDGRAVIESDTGKAYVYSTSLATWVDISSASLYRNFTTVTVVNTTTETAVATQSIPGGTFKIGDIIRITAVGDYLNDSGAQRQLTFRLKYGSTTMLATTALALATSSNRRKWRMTADLVIPGTSAQRVGASSLLTQAESSNWARFTDGNVAEAIHVTGYGTAAEAIASTLTLQLTAEHNLASVSVDIRCHIFTIERIGA
jgi:hypothetical protein